MTLSVSTVLKVNLLTWQPLCRYPFLTPIPYSESFSPRKLKPTSFPHLHPPLGADLLTFLPLPPVHREAGAPVHLCQRLAHLGLGLQYQQLHLGLHVVRPPPQLAQVGHRRGHEAAAAAGQLIVLLLWPAERCALRPGALAHHLGRFHVPEGDGGQSHQPREPRG